MKVNFKKILSISAGILFLAFLILLPEILIQSTVKSVNLAVKLKNDVTRKKTGQPPIATIEPIEKVGFYHFLPGATAYNLDTTDIDLTPPPNGGAPAVRAKEQVIADAKSAGANIISLADSDSTATNDYNFNLAKAAKQNGFRTTLNYNDCLDFPTLKNILPYLDAVEIEIGETGDNYCATSTGAALAALKGLLPVVKNSGVELEISDQIDQTTGSTTQINEFDTTVGDAAGKNTIIHFVSGDLPDATTSQIIIAAREQALRDGFKYVYTGGFDDPLGENTYCADGTVALSRQEDYLLTNNLVNGKCADGTAIPGVWK